MFAVRAMLREFQKTQVPMPHNPRPSDPSAVFVQSAATQAMTWMGVFAASQTFSRKQDADTTLKSCRVCFPATPALERCLKRSLMILPGQEIPPGTAENFANTCFPNDKDFETYAHVAFDEWTYPTRVSLIDAVRGCACRDATTSMKQGQ